MAGGVVGVSAGHCDGGADSEGALLVAYEALAVMHRCGDAAGLYAVTHAMAVEYGFLDHWRARARWSLPFLCRETEYGLGRHCWPPLYTPPPECWTVSYSRGCVREWLAGDDCGHRRPCSSPRRNQCRPGLQPKGSVWETRVLGEREVLKFPGQASPEQGE